MSQETNPFRLSMLRRSQSPLEDPFEPAFGSNDMPTLRHPSESSSGSTSSLGNAPVVNKTNPFRVDLHDSQELVAHDPPPYIESEGRRHSEPTLVHTSDEKQPLPSAESREDRYREGYEQGLRMARERERQRRREYRERRARQSSAERSGERTDYSGSANNHSEHRSSSNGEPRSSSHHDRSSRRHRSKSESAGHHHSHRTKPKPITSLDVIDKMDVTGFYGGSGFHHDGPFDACAPHRNKASKRNVATPISAFPVDGPNNSLAVEDPRLLAYRKEETVYGRPANADIPPEITQASFDPTDRGAKIHGMPTPGLGSTTFIDGAPASRDAISQAGRQRSQSLNRSRSQRRKGVDDDFENDEPKSLLSRVRSLRVTRH